MTKSLAGLRERYRATPNPRILLILCALFANFYATRISPKPHKLRNLLVWRQITPTFRAIRVSHPRQYKRRTFAQHSFLALCPA